MTTNNLQAVELYGGPLDGASKRLPQTDATYTEFVEGQAAVYRRSGATRHGATIFGYITKDGARCTKRRDDEHGDGMRCILSLDHEGGCVWTRDVGGPHVD